MSEITFFYSDHGKPYKTREDAEERKNFVINNENNNGHLLRVKGQVVNSVTKVEVAEFENGFVVRQTISRKEG